MNERAKRLKALVESYEGIPANWDECSVYPAQWIADELGIDVPWPSYADEAEGRAMIEAAGGLVNLWSDVAKEIGVKEVRREPVQLGDVGVIRTSKHGQIGGVFADHGVFTCRTTNGMRHLAPRALEWVRTDEGVVGRPIVLKVWRI